MSNRTYAVAHNLHISKSTSNLMSVESTSSKQFIDKNLAMSGELLGSVSPHTLQSDPTHDVSACKFASIYRNHDTMC